MLISLKNSKFLKDKSRISRHAVCHENIHENIATFLRVLQSLLTSMIAILETTEWWLRYQNTSIRVHELYFACVLFFWLTSSGELGDRAQRAIVQSCFTEIT